MIQNEPTKFVCQLTVILSDKIQIIEVVVIFTVCYSF